MMVYNIEFMPTYLKYKYAFFFISISGQIRIFCSSEPDPDLDPWKKMSDPHPCKKIQFYHVKYLEVLMFFRQNLNQMKMATIAAAKSDKNIFVEV